VAKQTPQAALQLNITRFKNFLNYTRVYFKKRNPVKNFIIPTINYINELLSVKKKLKKIEYRINYERYKLKKTELILAQNSEHVFLKGRSLNQTR